MYRISHSNTGPNQTRSPLVGKEAGTCSPPWTQEGGENQILMSSADAHVHGFLKDFVSSKLAVPPPTKPGSRVKQPWDLCRPLAEGRPVRRGSLLLPPPPAPPHLPP